MSCAQGSGMLVMALAEGSAPALGAVLRCVGDPTHMHGIKHSRQLLADAVEWERPMATPSPKYADRVPPDEAVGGDLEGKLPCSGSARCPNLAPEGHHGACCADRSWGEFGSTGIGSCLQPAGASGKGTNPPGRSWKGEEMRSWAFPPPGLFFLLLGSSPSLLFLPFSGSASRAMPACFRAEQQGWLSIFLRAEEGAMRCCRPSCWN